MSETEQRQKFATVRTFSVEALNAVLKEKGRILCFDSRFDQIVEIKFLNELDLPANVITEQKLKMIRAILDT